MKVLRNFLVPGGLRRSSGDQAQEGDTVRLYLDTAADPDLPESILVTILSPVIKVGCGDDRGYSLSYSEDNVSTLRLCDILEDRAQVLDCCARLLNDTESANGFKFIPNSIGGLELALWNPDQDKYQIIRIEGNAGVEYISFSDLP